MEEMPIWANGEEAINAITHGVGAFFGLIGAVLLTKKGLRSHDKLKLIGYIIFGASMVILYTASMLYHGVTYMPVKKPLRYVDHCSVFILIAGTYTPFTLTTLRGPIGYSILVLVWGIALGGIISKIFFFDAVDKYTVLLYVAMGWVIIVSIRTLLKKISRTGLYWLVAGGITYTVGTYFYSHNIPFYHAVFHLFILGGTVCHFIAVYKYT